MLIAEDLLLIATDDATGKITVSSMQLDPALAGAVLMELVIMGRVGLDGDDRPKVVVLDPEPMADPVLDVAVRSLLDKGPVRPAPAIGVLTKGLRGRLNESLAERGILRREAGRVLGVFPTTRWPTQDSGPEANVRGALVAALVTGVEPDGRTAAVISVLTAAGMLGAVVDKPDLKLAKARGREISAGNWATDTVRKVIQEAQAAIATAVMVSTTVAVSSG